jgi:aryl-alcohol dehydrogenase-like predicted oxidoreductase
VRAFNWLIEHGYAFYWGTSEWSAHDIAAACNIAGVCGRRTRQNCVDAARVENHSVFIATFSTFS